MSEEPISLWYSNGIYKLFYIYSIRDKSNVNNYVCSIGNAISTDLINWEVQSTHLFHKKAFVYKGGIIIDINNVTGFGSKENPPFIALLIMRDQFNDNSEGSKTYPVLAYSNDNGISWTIAEDKINFPETFKDYPQNVNIFWHNSSGKWIMILGLSDNVVLYSSKDLFSWDFESLYSPDFFNGNVFLESPCLVPLDDGAHWVLFLNFISYQSGQIDKGIIYLIGYFDGHRFTNLSLRPCLLDYGNAINGGFVSVGPNSTNILIPWLNIDSVNSMYGWNKKERRILFPRKLKSHYNENNEIELSISPVENLKILPGRLKKIESLTISEKNAINVSRLRTPYLANITFNTSEIRRWNFPSSYGIVLRNDANEKLTVGYNTSFKYYFIDTSKLSNVKSLVEASNIFRMPFNHSDSTMVFKLYVYNSMVELYCNNDLLLMSGYYSVEKRFDKMDLFSENGELNLLECKINRLKLK